MRKIYMRTFLIAWEGIKKQILKYVFKMFSFLSNIL